MARSLVFVDVDTQFDFMMPGGRLHVPGAERVVANLGRLTSYARACGHPIVHTADEHDLSDAEISVQPDYVSTFPPHCLQGTDGAARIPETRESAGALVVSWDGAGFDLERAASASEVVLTKKRFDVFSNPAAEQLFRRLDPQAFVVYGVALDVCVKHAVEGLLAFAGDRVPAVYLVSDAVAALDAATGDRLLASWSARGVQSVTTAAVTAGTRPS